MDIDALLKKRYGGDRFNPVAGQSQMSFREWMDRHPSLQGAREGVARDKYESATSEKGGREFLRGTESLDGPVNRPKQFREPDAAMKLQMGGPDAPPKAGVGGTIRQGMGSRNKNSRSKKMLGAAERRGGPSKGAQPKQTKGNVQAQHPVVGRSDNKKIPASSGNKKMVNYPAKDKMKRGGIRGNK